MKRRKKGWFKKARKKFVNKRVFSWKLENYRKHFDYGIRVFKNSNTLIKYADKDRDYQIVHAISDLGFVKGFWKAREYAKKNDYDWCFGFDKKIIV